MVQVAHTPLVLKDFIMSLGADSYERAISSVVFTPTAASVTWQGGTPDSTFTDVATATWAAALTYAQDWDAVDSLSVYLYNNEGATVPAVFRPRNGKGASFSAQLLITPGSIGGAVNSVSESTVNLGCKSKPVIIPAAAAIPTITATAPVTGPVAGNKLVKVTGTGFTGATAVVFGAVAAVDFRVESDGVIYATAPAQAAGSKPIKVTNAVGISTTTGAYTYA